MDKNIKITEPNYVDMLTALKEGLENDSCMIEKVKDKAQELVDELFELLWKYST